MMNKDFRLALEELNTIVRKQYGDHAYMAGYCQSLLVNMFDCLSKKDQEYYARFVKTTVQGKKEIV